MKKKRNLTSIMYLNKYGDEINVKVGSYSSDLCGEPTSITQLDNRIEVLLKDYHLNLFWYLELEKTRRLSELERKGIEITKEIEEKINSESFEFAHNKQIETMEKAKTMEATRLFILELNKI